MAQLAPVSVTPGLPPTVDELERLVVGAQDSYVPPLDSRVVIDGADASGVAVTPRS
jgi:hypothetical protein